MEKQRELGWTIYRKPDTTVYLLQIFAFRILITNLYMSDKATITSGTLSINAVAFAY